LIHLGNPAIKPEGEGGFMRENHPARVVTRPRTIHLVQLTEFEVRELANIGNLKVISVALSSFFFGAFSNLGLAAITVPSEDTRVLAVMIGIALLSLLAGVLFAVLAVKSFVRSNRALREYLSREAPVSQVHSVNENAGRKSDG
jgi:hypothetical protein